IVGSAGAAGSRRHVEWTADIVREIATEEGLRFRLACVLADTDRERARRAIRAGEVRDFETGEDFSEAALDETVELVAQMGHEPLAAALDGGADVVIAGRACDDSAIAAFPIWRGADPGLSIHMGKILEC